MPFRHLCRTAGPTEELCTSFSSPNKVNVNFDEISEPSCRNTALASSSFAVLTVRVGTDSAREVRCIARDVPVSSFIYM